MSDNPSGMYCPACRATGVWHCAHPEECGGMIPMPPRIYDDTKPVHAALSLLIADGYATDTQRATARAALKKIEDLEAAVRLARQDPRDVCND